MGGGGGCVRTRRTPPGYGPAVVDSLVGFGIDREGIHAGWDFWDWTRVRRKLERGMKEGGRLVLSECQPLLFIFVLATRVEATIT